MIAPLQRVQMGTIRDSLRFLEFDGDNSDMDTALKNSLENVSQLLNPVRTPLSASEDSLPAHVFLISPYIGSVSLRLAPHITVHVINPSLFPWRHRRSDHNGWHLRSVYGSTISHPGQGHSVLEPNFSSDSLSTRLRTLLNHARRGSNPGKISNVKIAITPRADCVFEAIWGKTRNDVLAPGESIQIFVKVALPTFQPNLQQPSTSSAGSWASSAHGSRPGSIPVEGPPPASRTGKIIRETGDADGTSRHRALFHEVDILLGEATTRLLTVRVSYSQSMFPNDTVLTMEQSAIVKRHEVHTPWQAVSATKLTEEDNRSTDLMADDKFQRKMAESPRSVLHRRLAFFIAARHRPRRALEEMERVFGVDGRKSGCRGCVQEVLEELRWRVGVIEKNETAVG